MSQELPEAILTEKVIPVARGLDASTAPVVARALLDGGISTIEVTVEGSGGVAAIESLQGLGMTVGAGTVLTVDQAVSAVSAGAVFLVTPHLDQGLVEWGVATRVPMIPGGLTPTEIFTALRLGPAAVKVFPASLGGPDYLRSLLAPYPGSRLIPTGGIDGGNAAAYVAAGAVAIAVGGWLTAHEDMARITERARELRSKVV